MVAEYAAAPHGEKSAVLRREGLYQSQIREWTDARDAIVRGLVPKRNSHHRSGKPTQIKISGCHRSERGARAWLTVRAHISTLRKNGINILDGIRDSITGQPWQPAPG